MEDDELENYFDGTKMIKTVYSSTFIDHTEIETPVRSLIKGT